MPSEEVAALPAVKVTDGANDAAAGAAGKAGSFDAVDSGASPPASLPFSSSFALRAVDTSDKFVLKALDNSGEGPSPQLAATTVEGELDALAFAMGALWELAAESDVNQVRLARAARACGSRCDRDAAMRWRLSGGTRGAVARRRPPTRECRH